MTKNSSFVNQYGPKGLFVYSFRRNLLENIRLWITEEKTTTLFLIFPVTWIFRTKIENADLAVVVFKLKSLVFSGKSSYYSKKTISVFPSKF